MEKQEYFEKLLQNLDELLMEQSSTQARIRRTLRELWSIKKYKDNQIKCSK